jgi:Fe-S-cluster-containing dehydrogenase component
MEKYEIHISTERCTGCLRCELACSDLYGKSFNPSLARIQVLISDEDWSIVLTEDCNGCGICADHCFYDAVQKSSRRAAE